MSFKYVVQSLTRKDFMAAAKSFSAAKHLSVTFIAQKLRSPSETRNSLSTHHCSLLLSFFDLDLFWDLGSRSTLEWPLSMGNGVAIVETIDDERRKFSVGISCRKFCP
ncbi:hypothetical protein Adt_22025 [Abeliophyllum distichum]|uniref:Uncharacterized protein n=1 Tax=Abeliophyllum distichum TaxID=126358 RepID=A0ABD1T117_9LAMI